jgi:hypothetical protein
VFWEGEKGVPKQVAVPRVAKPHFHATMQARYMIWKDVLTSAGFACGRSPFVEEPRASREMGFYARFAAHLRPVRQLEQLVSTWWINSIDHRGRCCSNYNIDESDHWWQYFGEVLMLVV